MKENLFLVPVVYPEFRRTVENCIDITFCQVGSETLSKIDNPEQTRVWGVKDSQLNRTFYNKMEKGDILLFYNSGEYIYDGRLGEKFRSQGVSQRYWDGIPASLLYSINDLRPLSLPKEVLNEACEYKEAYQPQSLRAVDTQPLWKLEREYGSVDALLSEYR